jgi:uncharacterized protein (DUF1330 family)
VKEEGAMTAYLMVQVTVSDEARYQQYREVVVPQIMKFGGKLVVRNGRVDVLEGDPDPRPMVVFEFPSLAAIHAWWDSPEYVPVKKIREGAGVVNVWAVPGV